MAIQFSATLYSKPEKGFTKTQEAAFLTVLNQIGTLKDTVILKDDFGKEKSAHFSFYDKVLEKKCERLILL